MNYLDDLRTIIQINSYTQNKSGVDKVGEIFDIWFRELGFNIEIYQRELIGSH
ncbi:hypothetical protein [Candidatus Sulfurimonas marisnigri]|uniref:hypothetical protein n=1 Tax=Candidatus Sulfurimonas marisnigri TaxID=2740405 RepID=UPI001E47EE77|nr:hypothetical protein [Candidatus Sulfurimonas marisnigri]